MDRNVVNDYREYTLKQIVDSSVDIALYRSINVPIAKLKSEVKLEVTEYNINKNIIIKH